MQFVKNETHELAAVGLHIIWVENAKLSYENLLSVNCFDFVKIRPVHNLDSRLEISAELHEFDQKVFLVKFLLIFTYDRQHIEKCGARYKRLQTNVHKTINIGINQAFINLVKMRH